LSKLRQIRFYDKGACGYSVGIPKPLEGEASSQADSSTVAKADRLLSVKKEFADLFALSQTEGMLKQAAVILVPVVVIFTMLSAFFGLMLILKTLLWLSIGVSSTACLLSLWMWRNASPQFRVNQGSVSTNQPPVGMIQIVAITTGVFAATMLIAGVLTFQGAFATVAWLLAFIVPFCVMCFINEIRVSERTQKLVWIAALVAFSHVLGSTSFYFIGYYKTRYGPESRYLDALSKKDYETAIKATEQLAKKNKEPGQCEYLAAYPLLELGRVDEALAKSDAALKKSRLREHGQLKAQILFRLKRPAEAKQVCPASA
jgi:hypothetical protein